MVQAIATALCERYFRTEVTLEPELVKPLVTRHWSEYTDAAQCVYRAIAHLFPAGSMGEHLLWLETCLSEYPKDDKDASIRAALDYIRKLLAAQQNTDRYKTGIKTVSAIPEQNTAGVEGKRVNIATSTVVYGPNRLKEAGVETTRLVGVPSPEEKKLLNMAHEGGLKPGVIYSTSPDLNNYQTDGGYANEAEKQRYENKP